MGMSVVLARKRNGQFSVLGPFKTEQHAASYATELFQLSESTAPHAIYDAYGVASLDAPDPAIEASANA